MGVVMSRKWLDKAAYLKGREIQREIWWGNMKEEVLHLNRQIFKRSFNLLKTKRNLLYLRNNSVPRSKHLPPLL